MIDKSVAFVGASGRLGSRSISLLASKFRELIAVALNGDFGGNFESTENTIMLEGDIRRANLASKLVAHCDVLILSYPPSIEVIDAARSLASGIALNPECLIIHISQLGAVENSNDPIGKAHAKAHSILQESGANLVSLRCNLFSEQLVELIADSTAMFGEVWLPIGNGRLNPIACIDVASILVDLASMDNLERVVVFDVSGPASHNGHEICEAVSQILGYEVLFVEKSHDAWSKIALATDQTFDVIAHLGISAHQIQLGLFEGADCENPFSKDNLRALKSVLQEEELALRLGSNYIGHRSKRIVNIA